ncbi:MAG: glycosyltransferase [Magnetospiraceae bacterium]
MPSKPINIGFFPNWSVDNPYQKRLAGGLEGQSCAVSFLDYPQAALPLNKAIAAHPELDVLHLHWIAPYLDIHHLFWSKSPLKRALRLAKIGVDLALVRLKGKRLVWTVHNVMSHESRDRALELRVRHLIGFFAHRIILHSPSALELICQTYGVSWQGKAAITPHASYGGAYAEDPARQAALQKELGLEDGNVVFMFIGAVRPYKGVDTLVETFQRLAAPQARLIIAGRCTDDALTAEIEAAAQADPRIIARLGFVPDADISPLLNLASVMVLPFVNTLTSGSALLAMTYGKPLILPERARVFDVPGDEGALYFEDSAFLVTLEKAMEMDMAQMGAFNRSLCASLTWESMAAKTREAYVG